MTRLPHPSQQAALEDPFMTTFHDRMNDTRRKRELFGMGWRGRRASYVQAFGTKRLDLFVLFFTLPFFFWHFSIAHGFGEREPDLWLRHLAAFSKRDRFGIELGIFASLADKRRGCLGLTFSLDEDILPSSPLLGAAPLHCWQSMTFGVRCMRRGGCALVSYEQDTNFWLELTMLAIPSLRTDESCIYEGSTSNERCSMRSPGVLDLLTGLTGPGSLIWSRLHQENYHRSGHSGPCDINDTN